MHMQRDVCSRTPPLPIPWIWRKGTPGLQVPGLWGSVTHYSILCYLLSSQSRGFLVSLGLMQRM